MKALIFSEGNGYGHVARDKRISEHFGLPIMTFGRGAEYCRNSGMDFIEIPTPYLIESGNGRVRIKPDMADLAALLKPNAISSLKQHFSKVDFVIVDGSPLALALAMLGGKKSIYITNDTSSLVGVYGLIQKKLAASLSNTVLKSADSIIVPDFPPPLTITMLNLDSTFPLNFSGPLLNMAKQEKHNKKYLVVGPLKEKLEPILGDKAIYGTHEKGISPFYRDAGVVICHGGHTTMMEALSFGKPVVCIVDGMYSERCNNADMLERKGVGVRLDEKLLSEHSIMTAIGFAETLDKKKLEFYKKTAGASDPMGVIEAAISRLKKK